MTETDKPTDFMDVEPARMPPVAIIGIGCIFPKSPAAKGFWRLIVHGIDAITDVPPTHWSSEDYFDPDPKTPDHVYCKRGGFLSPIDFDPSEFGIPPSILEATDSSQLLGLVTAQMAMIDAGYGPDSSFDRHRTSVILGVTGTQELVIPLGARLSHPIWRKALADAGVAPDIAAEVMERISGGFVPWQENSFPGLLGNVVAGRICNRLDLGGTNCVVDAACASSLSAVHLALMELATSRSDMVITGGVDTLNDIFMHVCFSRTQILSPTGDVRPFSKDADGTLLGEGLGMVVLKRLTDAERDNDRIYAVIKGMGTASDAKSQSIYAPRAEGQARALRTAYRQADIHPATIELVEAHGTGTRVGDMVEFTALKQIFTENPQPDGAILQRCALGSIKSMIGHTKAAAGSAGLIKAALSLHHKVIPPTLKAETPDPELDIQHSPFYVNISARPWPSSENHPRRAGVSAFGFGGSNFHAVLEEYSPQKTEIAWNGTVEIVSLSAPSVGDLKNDLTEWRNRSAKGLSNQRFSELAAKSRTDFSAEHACRLPILLDLNDPDDLWADTMQSACTEALESLESHQQQTSWNTSRLFFGSGDSVPPIAFLFPGQGSQYVGMGRELACTFPEALNAIDMADRVFSAFNRGIPHSEADLIKISNRIYPIGAADPSHKQALQSTRIAQPAIGAISLGMVQILERFGIKPDITCGHSYGELTALVAAGWISPETFQELSAARGHFMETAGRNHDAGGMIAVKAPIDALMSIVENADFPIALANINSPIQGVLSGSHDAIVRAEGICREKGFSSVRLPVAAAFHSPLVQEAAEPFEKFLSPIDIRPSTIPVIANVTGTPYPYDPEMVRSLLGKQITHPVQYLGTIEYLYEQGVRTFVEVGPRSILTGLVRSILKNRNYNALSLDASSGKESAMMDLAKVLCRLAAIGYPVRLTVWESGETIVPVREPRMKVPLSGANYQNPETRVSIHRSPRKTAPLSQPMEPPVSQPSQPSRKRVEPLELPMSPNPRNVFADPQTVTPVPSSSSSHAVSAALQTVQEGLRAMQSLQAQTADTHKLFLQTQTEAGKTLQQMMEHTRRIAEASIGIAITQPIYREPVAESRLPGEQHQSEKPRTEMVQPRTPSDNRSMNIHQSASMVEEPIVTTSAKSIDPERTTPAMNASPSGEIHSGIETRLLEVVSQLTGYPVEMLALDMDIEADLGIDSIKRVEILATLEEKMPGLPAIPPDTLGTLKTLGQIKDFLTQQSPGSPTTPLASAADVQSKELADIETRLLEVVSQLTGYPVEMLALDMDIEADLGIDSIKRVEILATLEEKMPGLPAIPPDTLGTLKTLGQIVAFLKKNDPTASIPVTSRLSAATPQSSEESDTPERQILSAVPENISPTGRLLVAANRPIVITDDGTDQCRNIADFLVSKGHQAMVASVDELLSETFVIHPAGLIITAPVWDGQISQPDEIDIDFLKKAFLLARRFGNDLMDAAAHGGGLLVSITRLDGAFGLRGNIDCPIPGGLAGLIKTAAIEWPNVRCRAIDIDTHWQNSDDLSDRIYAALCSENTGSGVEMGLSPDLPSHTAYRVKLEPADYPAGSIRLGAEDVVVITGGARGVTAQAAIALAETCRSTLILIGRSPQPVTEPNWLASEQDPTKMKQAVLRNELAGRATPKELESAFRKYLANREILTTVNTLQSMGCRVAYHTVDVRRTQSVSDVLNTVRMVYGPITAVIHGAGVLEDRLILDKTPEQFQAVFDTKVAGFQALLAATRNDPLKYIVCFSSISARIGNRGQADYAMANEVLNKMAHREATIRKDCRVVSINWGPWDGGMVDDTLRREFERNHVRLIPLTAGARCMIQEMQADPGGPVEVVIGSGLLHPPAAENRPSQSTSTLTQSIRREIDIDRYPILESHILNGKPVVPFALITEWLGHGALHENPGLQLSGLDDIRILKGIRLDDGKKTIRLMTGKTRKNGTHFEMDVEIRDGFKDGKEVIHTRARAVLTNELSIPPVFDISRYLNGNHGYSRSMEEVYDKILFHGNGLKGLQRIITLSSQSMVAELASAPPPDQWTTEPLRSRWIGDPLVLDAAFQMAIVWCFEQKGMVSLPSFGASYRQYCNRFPADGVMAVLEIRDVGSNKMLGDFTFLDARHAVIATLSGYEAVMDASLSKSFRNGESG